MIAATACVCDDCKYAFALLGFWFFHSHRNRVENLSDHWSLKNILIIRLLKEFSKLNSFIVDFILGKILCFETMFYKDFNIKRTVLFSFINELKNYYFIIHHSFVPAQLHTSGIRINIISEMLEITIHKLLVLINSLA